MGAYFASAIKDKEDNLEHHGILGMKWGIRRYQNADGSLTAEGKARMDKVANSKIANKIDTNLARTIYAKNAEYANAAAVTYSRKAVKLKKKSEKYAEETEKHKELIGKSEEAIEKSKVMSRLADLATKKVSEIDEGSVKAGRDFIVQKDLNIQITQIPTYKAIIDQVYNPQVGKLTSSNPWLGSNEYRVIEKNGKPTSTITTVDKAKQEADKYHKQGIYTMEYTDDRGKCHVDPIKDERTARAILKDYAFKEQEKAIKESQKTKK